jgi:carnitine O-acetyltransferase
MDSWRWMFDCCRVPSSSPADYGVSYTSSNHTEGVNVVVVHKNRFWSIDVQDKATGSILPPESLEKAFAQILSASEPSKPTLPIGLLTSLPRDDWTKAYDLLVGTSSHNAAALKEIHRSAFVVCLDSSSPKTMEEFSRALWHGGMPGADFQLSNRW